MGCRKKKSSELCNDDYLTKLGFFDIKNVRKVPYENGFGFSFTFELRDRYSWIKYGPYLTDYWFRAVDVGNRPALHSAPPVGWSEIYRRFKDWPLEEEEMPEQP
ncbi:hypothetical protein E2P64_08385 [Candidatus Bathyarchaeota archaeon]|nr:hypothetical protein E2P64_08385 [Candidatus Bathyarchaeota archaeon]